MAPTTSTQVLADLAWETLLNELEEWLDAGHPEPMPETLDERPTGALPERLHLRLAELNARLGLALRDMEKARDGVGASRKANAMATAATTAPRGSSYLDVGA